VNIKDFPNPNLQIKKEHWEDIFTHIDSYIESIGPFIYTDIRLSYRRDDSRHIHAWIQRFISENLLRSLYLRNAFVDSFNSGNLVAIYLPLKAWMEVVGVLAYLLNSLKQGLPSKELYERFRGLASGNRGSGSMRVGDVDAVNVMTLIQKADKFLADIVKDCNSDTEHDLIKMFTDYYDVASNPSHPTYDAHEIIGEIKDGGSWHAHTPESIAKLLIERRPMYGGLLLMPVFTYRIVSKIFDIEKDHFEQLKSRMFFE
jgi:hypothetical protein